MKKYIFLIFTLITLASCKTETPIIDGNTALKDVPQYVFSPNYLSKIQVNDTIVAYQNNFNRLPNSEFSKFYLKKHTQKYIPFFNLTLNVSANNKITFEGAPNDKKHLIKDIQEFSDFAAQGKSTLLHLNFDQNLPIKDFYNFIKFIKPIDKKNHIQINKDVYIYDIKKLPNCDCSL